jgi:hypothetical protein
MKKVLIVISIMLLASCARESASVPVRETLQISGTAVKAHLVDGVNAVWDAGDHVSVFFEGGANERWDYTGADGASRGSISHEGTAYRVGSGRFTAVYPYDSGASMSQDVITTTIPASQTFRTSSYGWALMVSSTDNASLQFRYACSFIRVCLRGAGAVKNIQVQGNNNEMICGTAKVNIAGSTPSTTVSAGGKVITLSGTSSTMESLSKDAEKDFWIGLAPGSYSKGLTITVTLANNSTETISMSDPVTVGCGEVVSVHGLVYSFMTLSVDFTNKNNVSPALPTTAQTTDGNYSFTSGGTSYTLTFHPGSGRNYMFYNAEGFPGLLIGMGGAWIKLPVIEGHALYEVEYRSAGASGSPYISSDGTNPVRVSNQLTAGLTQGENYTMTLYETESGKQYYLMVGSGNLRIAVLTLRYIAI